MSDQDHATSTALFATILKVELEDCLQKIQTTVSRARVDDFVALGRPEGPLLRYPAFRWVFPIF